LWFWRLTADRAPDFHHTGGTVLVGRLGRWLRDEEIVGAVPGVRFVLEFKPA